MNDESDWFSLTLISPDATRYMERIGVEITRSDAGPRVPEWVRFINMRTPTIRTLALVYRTMLALPQDELLAALTLMNMLSNDEAELELRRMVIAKNKRACCFWDPVHAESTWFELHGQMCDACARSIFV